MQLMSMFLIYGQYNSERMPTYATTDIKLTMPLGGGWTTYIQVSNLFNNKKIDSYQYKTDYSEKREVKQLPRLFIGGICWEFQRVVSIMEGLT